MVRIEILTEEGDYEEVEVSLNEDGDYVDQDGAVFPFLEHKPTSDDFDFDEWADDTEQRLA